MEVPIVNDELKMIFNSYLVFDGISIRESLAHNGNKHIFEMNDKHESSDNEQSMHDVHPMIAVFTWIIHLSEADKFTSIVEETDLHHENVP